MTSHVPIDLASARENTSNVVLFSKPLLQTTKDTDASKAGLNKPRSAFGDIGNRAGKVEGEVGAGLKDLKMKSSLYGNQGALKPRQNRGKPITITSSTLPSLSTVANQQREVAKMGGRTTRLPPSGTALQGSTSLLQQNTNSQNLFSHGLSGNMVKPSGGLRKAEVGPSLPRRGILKHTISAAVSTQEQIKEEEAEALESEVDSVAEAFSEQRLSELPEDIDARDGSNYMLVSEYIGDIMDYVFALEKKFPIEPKFLEGRNINSRMRAVLMDWLVEVHNQYNFSAETLYLCNNIMDRFLSIDKHISRGDLQLVGVTSLFLASKYEEVYVPSICDFAVISDNAFTVGHIRNMETRILQALSFDLSCPQPCFFLRRFSKAAHADVKLHSLAKYIMELSVIDYNVVDLMPSAVAAASLALALMILNKNGTLLTLWNRTLEHYSTYRVETLRPIALKMAHVLANAQEEQSKLKAVKQKYSKGKTFFRTSRLEELNLENWKERVFLELEA